MRGQLNEIFHFDTTNRDTKLFDRSKATFLRPQEQKGGT